jgi:cytochrome c oxidase assembly protein subunit 11
VNPEAKKTLRRLIIAVPLMFAFGFALVPLYDVFCEVTGINGKVFQSESAEKLLTDEGRPLDYNLFLPTMKICHGFLSPPKKL